MWAILRNSIFIIVTLAMPASGEDLLPILPGTILVEQRLWSEASLRLKIKPALDSLQREALAARIMIHERPDDRTAIADGIVGKWDKDGFSRPEHLLKLPTAFVWEIGWWWTLAKRYDAALAVANEMGSRNVGGASAEAAQLISFVCAAQSNWENATEKAEAAIRLYKLYDYSGNSPRRLERLSRYLEKVKLCRALAEHGSGYVLLCEANRARLSGDTKKAHGLYGALARLSIQQPAGKMKFNYSIFDETPEVNSEPVPLAFHDAAVVQRYACSKGEDALTIARDEKALIALISNGSPFASSAALALGENAYLSNLATAECIKYFELAISLAAAESQKQHREAYGLPFATSKKVTTEGGMRAVAGWSQMDWFKENPEKLYAFPWCNWMPTYTAIRAHHGCAVAHFLNGDVGKALECIQATQKLDVDDQILYNNGLPSNYARLRDGFLNGRFYATRIELSMFKGSQLGRLLVAEIAMETERWKDAVAGYRTLLQGEGLNVDQKAYVEYAMACALIFMGDRQAANALLIGFQGPRPPYRKSPSYWRAVFAKVSIIPVNEAVSTLTALLYEQPPPDVRLDLLMNLGQITYGMGRRAEAAKWFGALLESGASGWREAAARNFLNKISIETQSTPSNTP